MNIHDIELPPMPDLPAYSSEVFDREVKVVSETMAEQLMHDYARAAIEPYAQRIRELESQLEAIGAGGVSSQRITSQRRGEPVVLATYHAVVSEDYKYIQRDIRTNQLEIYEEREDAVTAALDHFGVIPVYVTSNEGPLFTAPQPAEPVKVPSDDDIRRVARDMYLAGDLTWIGFDRDENGEYTQPTITGGDITLFRALLARYGHPVEPEGWQLVPKEPIDDQWGGLARDIIKAWDFDMKRPRELFKFLERSGTDIPQWLRDDPEMKNLEHMPRKGTRAVLIYKAMLEAAPEPPCTL